MSYFKDVNTIEEAKKLYKKLAIQNHPDRGADEEIMKAINSEYEKVIRFLLENQNFNNDEIEEEIQLSKLYQSAINKIAGLENIIIEIVNHWIWVSGDTFTHKEQLKNSGFLFASKKKMWFFRAEEFKCQSRKNQDIEIIRAKYGSKIIKTNSKTLIK